MIKTYSVWDCWPASTALQSVIKVPDLHQSHVVCTAEGVSNIRDYRGLWEYMVFCKVMKCCWLLKSFNVYFLIFEIDDLSSSGIYFCKFCDCCCITLQVLQHFISLSCKLFINLLQMNLVDCLEKVHLGK